MATLTGSDVTQAESTTAVNNLSSPVRTDWIEFPQSATSVNRKSGGGSSIGLPTLIGPNSGTASWTGYNGQGPARSWTGGTPTATGTNVQEGVFYDNTAAVAAGQGIQFVVPADTTQRTLEVGWFSYSGTSRVNAHLSDSSAADYTLNTTTTGLGNLVWHKTTITYAAGSASQTLTVQITMQSFASTYGQVGIDFATITAASSNSTVTLSSVATDATVALSAKETYTSALAVAAANATSSLAVKETFIAAVNPITAQNATASLAATETFPAAITVAAQDATVSLQAKETYTASLNVAAQDATVILSAIQIGTVTPSFGQSTSNITLDDTFDDWVEWPGFGTQWNSGNLNRRSAGSGELPDFPTLTASANFQGVRGNGSGTRNAVFTNGTLGSGTNFGGGIYSRGSAVPQGVRYAVPAGATTRTLKIYAWNYIGTAELRLQFANGGSQTVMPLTATAAGATDWYVITVQYRSPVPTTLNIDLVQTATQDITNSQMGIQAVTITGAPPPNVALGLGVTAQAASVSIAAVETYTVALNVPSQNATASLGAKETFVAAVNVAAANASASLAAVSANVFPAALHVQAANALASLAAKETFTAALASTAQSATVNLGVKQTFRVGVAVTAANATANITLDEFKRRYHAAILGPQ